MRSSLFIKVFVGFWLISIAVLASWLLANRYFDALPGAGPAKVDRAGPPPQFMLRLSYTLQNAERDELAAIVREAAEKRNVRFGGSLCQ